MEIDPKVELEELKTKWAPIIREYLEPRSIDLNVAISRAEVAERLVDTLRLAHAKELSETRKYGEQQHEHWDAAAAECSQLKALTGDIPHLHEEIGDKNEVLDLQRERIEAVEGLAREMLTFLRDRQGRKGVWLAAIDDFSEKARKIGLL